MLVMSQRWNDFPATMRKQLEKRLLRGYSRLKGENKKEHEKWRAWGSLNRIHWLNNNGCRFSFDLQTESAKLKIVAVEWQPQYAAKAVASMESRGGFVGTDADYSELITQPLNGLLDKAKEISGREFEKMINKDPFAGLSSKRPVRALSALSNATKRGDCPEWAWQKFLYSQTRENDKPRFSALIARRIANLPDVSIAGLVQPAADWLLKCSKTLIVGYPVEFELTWSKIIHVLRTEPGISKTSLVRGNKEPAWATEALNAPVGKLAQAIMNDPQKNGLKGGKGFPVQWTNRAEELLSLPGDHRRYALVILAFNLNWFFHIAPNWTSKYLLTALANEDEDQEAFWEGFFWGAKHPENKLFLRLKPWLLKLAVKKHVVGRREANVLSALLLSGWERTQKKTAKRLVTNEEMRTILLNADDDFRGQLIWHLERWSSDEKNGTWKANLPVFFSEVWPRQKQAKSPSVTAKLCDLAFSNGEIFPIVVDAILPLVTKIDEEGTYFPHLRGKKDGIVTSHPEKLLELMWEVLSESATKWPYGVDEILAKIGDAKPSLLNDLRLIELKRRLSAR